MSAGVNGAHNGSTMATGGRALAVIPARGGSKQVPRKNLKLLGGKPLIAVEHRGRARLDRARSLHRLDRRRGDRRGRAVARRRGAVPRPAEYAQDNTPGPAGLPARAAVARRARGYRPAMVVHLRPTLPFREPRQIDEVVPADARGRGGLREVGLPRAASPHKMWKLYDGRRARLGPVRGHAALAAARAGLPASDPGPGLLVGRAGGRDPHRGRSSADRRSASTWCRTSSTPSRAWTWTPTTISSLPRRSWRCSGGRGALCL